MQGFALLRVTLHLCGNIGMHRQIFRNLGPARRIQGIVHEGAIGMLDNKLQVNAAAFRIDWTGWRPGAPIAAATFEGHDSLVALDQI